MVWQSLEILKAFAVFSGAKTYIRGILTCNVLSQVEVS